MNNKDGSDLIYQTYHEFKPGFLDKNDTNMLIDEIKIIGNYSGHHSKFEDNFRVFDQNNRPVLQFIFKNATKNSFYSIEVVVFVYMNGNILLNSLKSYIYQLNFSFKKKFFFQKVQN
jgi:hypothetical protein